MEISPILVPLLALSIPIIAIGARTVRRMIEFREKQMESQASLTAEKAAQYAAHTERLEQRVRVLERIITDRGIAVADEIELLRDQRDH